MKTAIYATLFHSISTDQKPQHFKCPTGKDSWCFFQAALARGEVPGPHVKHGETPLKETHLAKIMPIYQRLASNELLQRCIRCVTQNANESLHSIIWGKCSKETSATLRRVTIAVCDAVCEFNFGESATADEGAAKIFPEELAKFIDGEYSADQLFNADETGLYWKKLPNRTYVAKDEKTASGHKASKDRVTLLLCSNASGDRILKPLLINKSLRPRALKGKDLKQLPAHWMANPKAWMTTAIFKEWFNNCFVPEVEAYIKKKSLDFKVLLIVDNAASHPQLEHPNVQLVFLPPNTTSLIQPLDQGIIATFKKYYIKTTCKFILNKLENESLTVKDVWKQFSIFDCLIHAASASAQIRPRTLNACPEGDNDEEEKSTPLNGKLIQEGLQLCSKLENHFLINDPNSERASKLQRRATQNENEVCENPWPLPQISIAETVSSDDEGDLESLRKRCKPLSDSDND
ncbi:tigger transposable element-derived protein 1 [Trichonephila clavipes]|nr:tigger transposable element-derived protein 1 [Trichonephila clavipes]